MTMSTEMLAEMLALVGVVILIAALMSGLMERANLPQVAVFLILGAAIGPFGLGLMQVGLDSPVLRVVATLALALVLFTDAVTLNLQEVRKHMRLGLLILGPGTLLAVVAMAGIAVLFLGLHWIEALVLSAALASTDPVMLRGLLRRKDLTASSRIALRLESGMNDVVLLPILIIAMAFLPGNLSDDAGIGKMLVNLFVLGPVAGIIVGFVSIATLRLARERIGVRRDYESIYSLGVCFASFAAAESVHGSGFLACFAAGVIISAMDKELCDCFVEYGETTAEMLLLFTFVLLGGSLIWTGLSSMTIGLAALAILCLVARPLGLFVALAGEKMDRSSRWIVAWFGPRGLSSLLLILLPVFAGIAGSSKLFEICTVVVLLSILVHGGSIFALGKKNPTESTSHLRQTGTHFPEEGELFVTVQQISERISSGLEVKLVDVRSHRSYDESQESLLSAIRIDPDEPVKSATAILLSRDAWAALFCT